MEYRVECGILQNPRVRYYFRYPIGKPFDNYYSDVAKKCIHWAEKEFADYLGRGITYRFFAGISFCGDGVSSVTMNFSLNEKGGGQQMGSFYAQNWLDSGYILSLRLIAGKELSKKLAKNSNFYFDSNGELCFFDEKGQKNVTGVKFGKLSQEILP